MSKITSLEAVKIQARAVGPILKSLEAEIGEEKARKLIGDAIADAWADFALKGVGTDNHPRDVGGGDFPVDSVIVTDAETEYRTKLTNCKFAEYFRSIDEPVLGALLTCNIDHAVYGRGAFGWHFERPQTQMMGADYCDFCFTKKSD